MRNDQLICDIKDILNTYGEVNNELYDEGMTMTIDENGFDHIAEDIAEIISQLKDKLHRRNMQIKDLKAEVSRLEEIHNINLDSIAKLETKLLQ